MSVSLESLGFILWEPLMTVQNSMGNHQIVVKIFQSKPKWWTDRPREYTDVAIYRHDMASKSQMIHQKMSMTY